jgi:hypothetical protein
VSQPPGRHSQVRLDPRFRQHLRIEPASCPGGVVVHVVDDEGELLTEHVLRSPAEADAAALIDTQEARRRAGRLWLYLYDGDNGDCVGTLVVEP